MSTVVPVWWHHRTSCDALSLCWAGRVLSEWRREEEKTVKVTWSGLVESTQSVQEDGWEEEYPEMGPWCPSGQGVSKHPKHVFCSLSLAFSPGDGTWPSLPFPSPFPWPSRAWAWSSMSGWKEGFNTHHAVDWDYLGEMASSLAFYCVLSFLILLICYLLLCINFWSLNSKQLCTLPLENPRHSSNK